MANLRLARVPVRLGPRMDTGNGYISDRGPFGEDEEEVNAKD